MPISPSSSAATSPGPTTVHLWIEPDDLAVLRDAGQSIALADLGPPGSPSVVWCCISSLNERMCVQWTDAFAVFAANGPPAPGTVLQPSIQKTAERGAAYAVVKGNSASGERTPEEARPEEARPEEARPEEARPDEADPDEGASEAQGAGDDGGLAITEVEKGPPVSEASIAVANQVPPSTPIVSAGLAQAVTVASPADASPADASPADAASGMDASPVPLCVASLLPHEAARFTPEPSLHLWLVDEASPVQAGQVLTEVPAGAQLLRLQSEPGRPSTFTFKYVAAAGRFYPYATGT